jgi:hypothetical protein
MSSSAALRSDVCTITLRTRSTGVAIGAALDELGVVIECSEQDDWRDRVDHVPLR